VHGAEHVVALEKGEAVLSGAAVLERVQVRACSVVGHAHVPVLPVRVRGDEDFFDELVDVDLRFHFLLFLLFYQFFFSNKMEFFKIDE
jgi:hypothetical protein